jgi:uncharacterized protein VirK/YbjX
MARNNYNFGFDDKTDVNEAAKSNIAQVVKQNEQSSKTYERKSLEENFSYLKRVEELLGQVEVLRNKVHETSINSSKNYEEALRVEENRLQGLKNIQQQSASMYANISTYIGTVQNNLANITVSVSEETRAQIKKAIQEEYAEERKKYIEEMDKFKEEFIADLKRGLREEAHEIIRSIRKSYEGMFWKTLLIVVACVMVAFGAFVKIFDGADKWLGILGMLLLMAALIIWAYKYSKLFGKE